jgi:hypothetical protein
MVSENWNSLKSIIPEDMTLRQVQDRLRAHLVTMACTLMSCAAYAALPHGLALRLRTLVRPQTPTHTRLHPCTARRKPTHCCRRRHHSSTNSCSVLTGY